MKSVHLGLKGLKIKNVVEETEAETEFQFFEFIRTTVLVNEVARYSSNLIMKGWWESANRMPRAKQALGNG